MRSARTKNPRLTMQQKLLSYMLLLAVLLLFALFSGILMLGRFESAEKNITQSLDLQMEVFEKDMSAYFEALAANSIDLSRYITSFIEQDPEISGAAFSSLTDDPQKIEAVQATLITPLVQKLQQQNCSGLFVMLDATVNSNVEHADISRTGLYLQQNRYNTADNIVLFRGNSSAGKSQDIMPHRKWRLEFNTDMFPDYEQIVSKADLPLEESYLLTKCTTLSGTSDDVVMMAVPIVGSGGQFYGICGYEVSADYFTTYHAQPTKEARLACMLMTAQSDGSLIPAGLSCSGTNNHVQTPMGSMTLKGKTGELSELSDGYQSYMGMCRKVTLTPNNPNHILAVMIPKADYTKTQVSSTLQMAILIILLLFFTISCCLFFSHRYLSPILKALEQIRQNAWEQEHSTIPEINDLFSYLAQQDAQHSSAISSVESKLAEATRTYEDAQENYGRAQEALEKAQLELQRLSYSRKNEVDPEQYQLFVDGLKTLTATEQQVLAYYMEGKTVKEIIELAGIKETTIRYHNRNIYSKLNVTSLKQLLLYASIRKQTEEGGTAQ